jgi:hypothetical protein
MFKYVLSTFLTVTALTTATAVMAQDAPFPTKAPSKAKPDFTTELGSPDADKHLEAYTGLEQIPVDFTHSLHA